MNQATNLIRHESAAMRKPNLHIRKFIERAAKHQVGHHQHRLQWIADQVGQVIVLEPALVSDVVGMREDEYSELLGTAQDRPETRLGQLGPLNASADLDGSKLGYAITVFALVSLKSQAEESLREFEEHMRKLPEVRECHMLNGEIDFILKIVSRDLQSFQEFLTSKLTPAPNVASVKTSLTIRTAKQLPGVPLD